MSGPAIGICAALERVRWDEWNEVVAMAPRSYAASVQSCGASALLLPPDEAAEADPERLLARIDGLLLAGGSDIDPGFYGAAPDEQAGAHWPERDRFEIALVSEALRREMPVLGICRGMQLLNVARDGALIQHLPDAVGHPEHRHTPGAFADHEVRLAPGSLASRAVGVERVTVKSHHHQGVDRLGTGLIASGWSPTDDVVEAIELDESEHPFALGVLWHPEEDQRSGVVASLVGATQSRAAAR